MSWQERVALAMLVTIGATAVDTGLMAEKREQFEKRFGVVIDNDVIVSVINRMETMLNGSEDVVIT